MQLTSHPVTTKELLKFMSLDSTEGTEGVISGDDYINNINRRKTNKVDVIVLRHYFSGFFCDFIRQAVIWVHYSHLFMDLLFALVFTVILFNYDFGLEFAFLYLMIILLYLLFQLLLLFTIHI